MMDNKTKVKQASKEKENWDTKKQLAMRDQASSQMKKATKPKKKVNKQSTDGRRWTRAPTVDV